MIVTTTPVVLPPAVRLLPGIAVAGVLAAMAAVVSAYASAEGVVIGPMLVALLLGLALAQVRPLPAALLPGLAFACRPLLRAAIVLSGLRIGLATVAGVGLGGVVAVAAVVAGTLAFGWWIGRRLGLGQDLVWYLAAGHAICGAAAIAAADSVLRGTQRDVTAALSLVTLFGTVLMLVCPVLGEAIGMPADRYGFFVGSSVHEVAQALAAGHARGEQAGDMASLVKMVRVAFLLPLGLFLGWVVARRGGGGGRRLVVPWFLVAFAGVAVLDGVGAVPAAIAAPLRGLSTVLMTMAMAALGLQSSLRAVLGLGPRPLVAAALTTTFVASAAWLLTTVRG